MIAHALSLSRGLTAPLFAWTLLEPDRARLAAGLLLLAIASDLLDGPIARSRGTASPRGRLIDHGSDFAFVECGLVALAFSGTLPWLLPVLVALAFAEYAIGSWGIAPAPVRAPDAGLSPSSLGRWNGVLYFVLPACVIAARLGVPIPEKVLDLFAWGLILSTGISIALRLRRLSHPGQPDR